MKKEPKPVPEREPGSELFERRHRSFTPDESRVLAGVVTSLVEVRKAVASFQAMEASLMSAALALALEHVHDGDGLSSELPIREVAAEIGAALRVSDRTVQRQLGQGHVLAVDFPATHTALTKGVISRTHATVITDAGAHLHDPDVRAVYESRVLEVAERESAARTRPFARMVAEDLEPRSLQERHDAAAVDRAVKVCDLDDGMSELTLTGPSTLVRGVHDRITQMGLAVKDADPDEQRSLDQLRADLLCDLALTGTPTGHEGPALLGAIKAEVHVTVPVLTLAGVSREPAMLDGVQPVDTATALQLVGAAPGWDRVLTHPVTGAVLTVDRYPPSAELKRFLKAIDQRCRFPRCNMPARRCDLDHEHPYSEGGATCAENLCDKCRRHHILKHHTAWSSKKQPDGTILWTSPCGREYPDRTPPRVAFTPAPF